MKKGAKEKVLCETTGKILIKMFRTMTVATEKETKKNVSFIQSFAGVLIGNYQVSRVHFVNKKENSAIKLIRKFKLKSFLNWQRDEI